MAVSDSLKVAQWLRSVGSQLQDGVLPRVDYT